MSGKIFLLHLLFFLLFVTHWVEEPDGELSVIVEESELLALRSTFFLGELAGRENHNWFLIPKSNALTLSFQLSLKDLLSLRHEVWHLMLHLGVDDALHRLTSIVDVGLGEIFSSSVHLLNSR